MRNPLTLAWWILILGILELSSLALDRTHHLVGSRAGLMLLKSSYLAFSAVLLVRFLSFRHKKSFETMVDSYNRLSTQPWIAPQGVVGEWRKLLFYMGLVVVASTNFLTPLAWRETTFQTSILLDMAFWLMALRWVVRAHWLKSLGRKERLKEGLDDARSRLKSQVPDLESPREIKASRWPFLTLFILALGVTLILTLVRWRTAPQVFRLTDLKGCLHKCLDRGLDRFHRDGKLEADLSREGCLAVHRDKVDVSMGFQRGELLLWAIEKPGFDYFGNGKSGDEGLILDAEGRFRATGGGK